MNDPPAMPATRRKSAAEEELIIPVVQEFVQVGVRQVDTGRGVRVKTAVTEKQEEVEALLRRDELEVVHVPVDRVVSADQAPVARYDGDTLVIPILEEVLVVEKRIRIKEEVRITMSEGQQRHVETVSLKSEQVFVERFNDADDEGQDRSGGAGRGGEHAAVESTAEPPSQARKHTN